MKTSFSMLSTAMDCRLAFKWKFSGPPEAIDPMPMKKRAFIGHILQSAVEHFYKDKFYKTPDQVTALMAQAVSSAAQRVTAEEGIDWLPGEQEGWILIAHESIAPIISVIKAERLLVPGIETEYSLNAKVGEHTIYGRADLILPMKESLVVLDGKGGKTYGRYTNPQQLIFYGLGILSDEKWLKFPDRLGFWWFRHTKIQWRRFKLEDRTEFIKDAKNTLDLLQYHEYSPSPGGHCRLCDFNRQCPAGRKFLDSKATVIPDLDIPDNQGFVSLD